MNSNTIRYSSPTINLNLPYQCNGSSIEKGPVGFYKNINTIYQGLIFKDTTGNITYFDIASNCVYPFDVAVWGRDNFVYVPNVNLNISSDS
jgi:hypothetical protein